VLRFPTLIFCTILISAIASASFEDFKMNQKVSVIGKLSSDLKSSPKISTFSPKGIPVHIRLFAKGKMGLSLVSFRGQKVKAKILITKFVDIRNYEGEVQEVVPAAADLSDF
jgi:hypothetical protein